MDGWIAHFYDLGIRDLCIIYAPLTAKGNKKETGSGA